MSEGFTNRFAPGTEWDTGSEAGLRAGAAVLPSSLRRVRDRTLWGVVAGGRSGHSAAYVGPSPGHFGPQGRHHLLLAQVALPRAQFELPDHRLKLLRLARQLLRRAGALFRAGRVRLGHLVYLVQSPC